MYVLLCKRLEGGVESEWGRLEQDCKYSCNRLCMPKVIDNRANFDRECYACLAAF